MIQLVQLVIGLCTAFFFFSVSDCTDSGCYEHSQNLCLEPGSHWDPGKCTSILKGFEANQNNLRDIIHDHFQKSLNYTVMAYYFSSVDVNKLGMHKLLLSYSDLLWHKAINMVKYFVGRGGIFLKTDFYFNGISGSNGTRSEMSALSLSLDMMKQQNEQIQNSIMMARKQKGIASLINSFDLDMARFLEDDYLRPYSKNIRQLVALQNTAARLSRKDGSKRMNLYLFDQYLQRLNKKNKEFVFFEF